MCIAIPGKIIEVKKDKAVIDYGDEKKEADNLINANIGDYVIVQMGKVVQKVKEEDAIKSIKDWESIR